MSALDKLYAMPVLKVDDWEDGTVIHEVASPFPTERKPLSYGREPESEREVRLTELIGTQSRITREGVERHLERDPKNFNIKVFETGDGRLYISDGHHRATAALLNGLKKIRATVVEVREGRERTNPLDTSFLRGSLTPAEAIAVLFQDLIEKAPDAFTCPVALVVDEKTALNGRDPHSRAHACAGLEGGRGVVYIAPKLVTGFLDDGTPLFGANDRLRGSSALRDRQEGVLAHELGHISLLLRGDEDHTERDADAEAERLFGKRIRYDIEDVQTVGRGVHPRPKRLDVDENPGRPGQHHGCIVNPRRRIPSRPRARPATGSEKVTGDVSGVVWWKYDEYGFDDASHDDAMSAAGWTMVAPVVGAKVLRSLSNGYEEWGTVKRVYKNGSCDLLTEKGLRRGATGRGDLWVRNDADENPSEPGMKRGTIKSFREYLNVKYADDPKHKNRRFEQKTRKYGDYLFAQDREQFDVLLAEALEDPVKFPDWVRP